MPPTKKAAPKKSTSQLPEYIEFVKAHRTKLWQTTEKGYSPLQIANILRNAGLDVRPKLLTLAMHEVLGAK